MAFSAFTLAETAAKALMRQALWRKVKDNDDSHEARVLALEQGAKLFEHFNFADAAPPITAPTEFVRYGGVVADLSYPAYSVIRFNTEASFWVGIETKRNLSFGSVTKPIKLIVRAKKLIDQNFRLGLRLFLQSDLAPPDGNGIWLERVDATNWRFVSYNGVRNNGANFAKPTDGNWFTVEIEFTNSPSDRALCRVDGVLKETLTTQLPTTSVLHGLVISNGAGGAPGSDVMDVDRLDFNAVGQADAA